MPEGPEILYLSKICGKHLIGHKLIDIVSNTKHRIKLPIKSELKTIRTYGKLMVFEFNDFYFHIHMGLTGWVTFKDAKYARYELVYDNLTMYIDDSRKFSKLKIYKDKTMSKEMNKELIEYMRKTAQRENKKKVIIDVHQNLRIYNKYYKDEGFELTDRRAKDNPFWKEVEIKLAS